MNVWLRRTKKGEVRLGIRMDDPKNAHKMLCGKCKGESWIEKMGGWVCSGCRHFVSRKSLLP